MRTAASVRVLAPAVVLGLVLTGCSTSNGNRPTLTVTQTFTSGAAGNQGGGVTVGGDSSGGAGQSGGAGPSGGAGQSGAGGQSSAGQPGQSKPGGSGQPSASKPAPSSSAPVSSAATSKAPTSSAKPSTSKPSATAGPVKKVNPLTVECAAILNVNDFKKAAGVTIPNSVQAVRFGAEGDSTGSNRCLYGGGEGKQKFSVRITRYKNEKAAADQVKVNVASEKRSGAQTSTSDVQGRPAQIMLRDGGLINVQYGDWVLAIASQKGVIKGDQAKALTALAEVALGRVLKNAS